MQTIEIEATDFSDRAVVIELDHVPTPEECEELFTDESIVIEF